MIAELISGLTIGTILTFAIIVDHTFNPIKRSKSYRLARLKNWLQIGLLYAFFYMGRYNMSIINNSDVRESLKSSKAGYGACLSLGYYSYALSMLNNGAS